MPRPAVGLILSAFENHPLLALSEGAGHGQLETRDFFTELIGNARYQPVMDRYVSGGAVTRDELRQIWEHTTQVSGIWSLPMYEQMLVEVRAVNAGLPSALRYASCWATRRSTGALSPALRMRT
jgi:hypothetical protein